VVASGDTPFTYEWHRGSQIVGDNSDTLVVPNATPDIVGPYYVLVSNRAGTTNSVNVSIILTNEAAP